MVRIALISRAIDFLAYIPALYWAINCSTNGVKDAFACTVAFSVALLTVVSFLGILPQNKYTKNLYKDL